IIVTLLLFLAVLWITFMTGIGISFQTWQKDQKNEIKENLQIILNGLSDSSSFPGSIELYKSVYYLLPEKSYFIIFDKEKQIITGFQMSSAMKMTGGTETWAINFFHQHKNEIDYIPVNPDDPGKGYFAFGETRGNYSRGNKKFLTSLTITIVTGIILFFLSSFIIAFVLSFILSRRVTMLVHGIGEIAAGNLMYKIGETGLKEFVQIAKAANALGMKLDNEKNMRNQWTQDITHDLRTPLTALRAQLEGIRDGVLDSTPLRYTLLLTELSRIETLVNDFNELINLESPEMKIHPEKINIEDFLLQLEQMFALKATQKNITFKQTIIRDNQYRTIIYGDRNLLMRASENLISNAIQYADKNGIVEIKIIFQDSLLLLSVFNTGKIIPKQEISRVFNRFYRGEYARRTKGSGLGLAITQRIVELHHGTIQIESSEGKGTIITMALPDIKNN
ncbi:MAG: HAMP domain-containing histidine kinase, partial [Spirochaetales bacterium]|nr:HAMP domain-containing histidine kinase [Spirochaetales bacterium]